MTTAAPYHFHQYRNDHPDFVADMIRHETRKDAALDKIARTSNRDKKRLLIRNFLNDIDLKKLYLFRSAQSKKQLHEYPPERLGQLAKEISPFVYYVEPVIPVNLRSSSGRRRTTYNFGPAKHALQSMVADLIRKLFSPSTERHFTVQGGIRAAIKAVQGHALEGFTFAIERDIAEFYPTVDLIELAKLLRPLPQSVVINVIAYAPDFNRSERALTPYAVDNAPLPLRGLLAQGSAASPTAAEVLMADLLKGMPDSVRVVSYADNVLIQGATPETVREANAYFEACAHGHPCGPLRLKASELYDIKKEGIHFLGYQGQWVSDSKGIEWEPGVFALDKLFKRIEEAKDEYEVLEAMHWILSWRRAYSEWTNGNEHVGRYLAELGGKLAMVAPSELSSGYLAGMEIVVTYCRSVRRRSATGQVPDLSVLLPDFQDGKGKEGRRPKFIRAVKRRLSLRERD